MTADTAPLLVYVLLLLAAVLLPYARTRPASDLPIEGNLGPIVLAGGALVITVLRGGITIEAVLVLVASSLGFGLRSLAGALVACLILAASLWWLKGVNSQLLIGAGWLVLALLARRCTFDPSGNGNLGRSAPAILAALLVAGLIGGLLTGATNDAPSATMAWHHWGAYISPVLPMLSGGVPYRDFPVQYGMGPTLLLAATCGARECWTGLYWVTVGANALYLATFGWAVLLLTRRMSLPSRLLAIAALACATLLWAGYPINWGNPIMTPSIGGLRFLPLAALLAVILTAEWRAGDGTLPRGLALAGHALWLLGLAWSPENGFFATLLWWPWLALRKADAAPDLAGKWRALVRGALLGLAAVAAGYGLLAIVFRLIFDSWAGWSDFLLYLNNPPGRMEIFALGSVWLAAAILFLGFAALGRSAASPERRMLYACLLAAFAAGSYYLSRSHDNNVLNLLPYLIVVMLAAQAVLPSQLGSGFTRAMLAGIIALSAAINFHTFTIRQGSPQVAGLQVGPSALVTRFAPSANAGPLIAPDAAALYAEVSAQSGEAVLLFDNQKVMPTAPRVATWTGVNNAANFVPLPQEEVARYVRQGAHRFRRPGWVIIENSRTANWLGLFGEAYNLADIRVRGGYTAWRLVPRNAR